MTNSRNNNPCYQPGALWRTRLSFRFEKNKEIKIPRNEIVMLVSYKMHVDFSEEAEILWKNQTFILEGVDVGLCFFIDPGGVNTKINNNKNKILQKINNL